MSDKSERQGYWYGLESRKQMGAVDVLNALRTTDRPKPTCGAEPRLPWGMGETDLMALRYLLEPSAQAGMWGPRN